MTTSQTQPNPIEALPGAEHFLAPPISPEERKYAPEDSRERIEALLQVDPDYRLALLESPPWNFTTVHLTQVNRVFDELLDAPARAHIGDLVAQGAPEAASSGTIAKQWFIEKGCNRLLQLLDETDLPDRMVVACCAWLEIHDVTHGAHLLHNSRTTPKPDFANFKQTPEEREADLRFANLT